MTTISPAETGFGMIEGMPEEEYHAHPALSASGMKQLLRSPLHFQQSRKVRVEKPAFDIGSAAHKLILGEGSPITFIDPSLLSSDGAVRSNAAKAEVERIRAEGRIPLKQDVFMRVQAMADAVLTHPKARALLEREGYTEVSLFAVDQETGVPLRGRVDRLTGALVVDVKTTTDVRENKLRSTIADYGYDVQAEVYRMLTGLVFDVEPEPVELIFVEKEPPFEVRVVRLGDMWQVGGFQRMRHAIEVFASCAEFDVWPGADEDGPVREIEPPAYYVAGLARLTDEGVL